MEVNGYTVNSLVTNIPQNQHIQVWINIPQNIFIINTYRFGSTFLKISSLSTHTGLHQINTYRFGSTFLKISSLSTHTGLHQHMGE